MVERWRWEAPRSLLSCLGLITFHLVIRIGDVKLLIEIEIFPHSPYYLWSGVLNLLVLIFAGGVAQPWYKTSLSCVRWRIFLSNHSFGKLNFPELNMNKGIMKFSCEYLYFWKVFPPFIIIVIVVVLDIFLFGSLLKELYLQTNIPLSSNYIYAQHFKHSFI